MPIVTNVMVTADHAVPVEPLGAIATVVVNSGDIVYYNDNPTVSATRNIGSISSGGSANLTAASWLKSAGVSSVTITIGDVTSSVVRASLSPYTSVEVSGHSYPFGDYATGFHGYPPKVAAMLGLPLTDRTIEGGNVIFDQQAAAGSGWCKVLQDLPRSAGTAPYNPASSLYIVQHGLNDLANLGPGAIPMSRIKMAFRAIISRIRAGSTGVFEDQHASVTLGGGGWGSAGSTASNSGSTFVFNTTNGTTITIAVPADFPGGTIALGYQVQQGTSATYTVTVDAVAAGSISTLNMATAVAGRANNGMCGIHRLTGLAPGAHTIVITTSAIVTAAAFDYWQIEAVEPPVVLVVNQPRMLAAGYQAYVDIGANFAVTDASVQQLNMALAQVVAEFDSKVRLVEIDSLFAVNAANFATGSNLRVAHPSEQGHNLIAAACLRAAQAGPWLPALATAS